MNKKKILIVLLAVLAIVAATVLILIQTGKLKLKKAEPTPAKVDLPPAPKYTKTDLPTDKLPEVFPKDLIQEKDPVIVENYQAEIEGGKTQYSIKYLSKNDLETNRQLYSHYFYLFNTDVNNTDNWFILSQNSYAESFYIQAVKGTDTVYINFNKPDLMEITLVRLNAKDSKLPDNK